MRIVSLYRHPVKGLSPEPLDRVDLKRGEFFPGDRLYAIENGPSGFDPDRPTFLPKIKFLMLMKQGDLAALQTRYDDATRVLTIRKDGEVAANGDLGSVEGRKAIEAFMSSYCKDELLGPPRILAAPNGFRFTDNLRAGFVSFLNKASLEELGKLAGTPVDARRFRANAIIEGPRPLEESGWIGKEFGIATLRLKIIKPIERCAAINVRPVSGARDLDLLRTMIKTYGRANFGFYAEVVASGPLAIGDKMALWS